MNLSGREPKPPGFCPHTLISSRQIIHDQLLLQGVASRSSPAGGAQEGQLNPSEPGSSAWQTSRNESSLQALSYCSTGA